MNTNNKLLEEFNFLNKIEHNENITKERVLIFLKKVLKSGKLLKDFFHSDIPLNSKQHPKEATKEPTELWKNKNECTPNDIIKAIVNNKVLKNLEADNHYPIERIELKGFDPDLKYLI